MASTILGGLSETKNMDKNVLDLCNKLRGPIEVSKKCTSFITLLYRSQVVNVFNYYVKILVDHELLCKKLNECIHVRM